MLQHDILARTSMIYSVSTLRVLVHLLTFAFRPMFGASRAPQEMTKHQHQQLTTQLSSSTGSHRGSGTVPCGYRGRLGRRLLKTLQKEYPDGRNAVIIMTKNDIRGKSWQTWFSTVAWTPTGSGQDWAWQGSALLDGCKQDARGNITMVFP